MAAALLTVRNSAGGIPARRGLAYDSSLSLEYDQLPGGPAEEEWAGDRLWLIAA